MFTFKGQRPCLKTDNYKQSVNLFFISSDLEYLWLFYELNEKTSRDSKKLYFYYVCYTYFKNLVFIFSTNKCQQKMTNFQSVNWLISDYYLVKKKN